MTEDAIRDDLAGLRKEFEGAGFTFGSVWASAGSGPEARRLYASQGTLLIASWNAAELRICIREELRRSHPDRHDESPVVTRGHRHHRR